MARFIVLSLTLAVAIIIPIKPIVAHVVGARPLESIWQSPEALAP